MHFDKRAEVYERARPPYPTALWDRLIELDLLRPGARVIELGAGTGQATGPLVEGGAAVTAIEPGHQLATRLRARVPHVHVLSTTAEAAQLPDASFDIAVAATSIHWLDLNVVLPKLHQTLIPQGNLAVWRNVFGDPEKSTPFRERISAIVAQRDGAPDRPGPGELDTEGLVHQLTTDGLFSAWHVENFRCSIELEASQVHDLFTTFSDWSTSEVDAAAEAVRDLGGRVTEHYMTPLIVVKRVDGTP